MLTLRPTPFPSTQLHPLPTPLPPSPIPLFECAALSKSYIPPSQHSRVPRNPLHLNFSHLSPLLIHLRESSYILLSPKMISGGMIKRQISNMEIND